MQKKLALVFVGIALAVSAGVVAQVGGFPSKPTFQTVRVGNQTTLLNSQFEVQTAIGSDPVIATYRNSSGVGVGVGRIRFDGLDAGSTRQLYGLIQTEIEANTAGSQGGALSFYTANLGASAERMRITAAGRLSLPGSFCTTGAACTAATFPVATTVTAVKDANETRTSTITPVQDSDLAITSVPAGYYRLRFFLSTDNSTSTGFVAQVTLSSGTFGTESTGSSQTNCNSANANGNYQYSGATSVNLLGCTGTSDEGTVTGELNFFTSGVATIAIAWAQQTSSGTATTMQRGSYIELTRLN